MLSADQLSQRIGDAEVDSLEQLRLQAYAIYILTGMKLSPRIT